MQGIDWGLYKGISQAPNTKSSGLEGGSGVPGGETDMTPSMGQRGNSHAFLRIAMV